jgi:hypothetical protein
VNSIFASRGKFAICSMAWPTSWASSLGALLRRGPVAPYAAPNSVTMLPTST